MKTGVENIYLLVVRGLREVRNGWGRNIRGFF